MASEEFRDYFDSSLHRLISYSGASPTLPKSGDHPLSSHGGQIAGGLSLSLTPVMPPKSLPDPPRLAKASETKKARGLSYVLFF